jgi:hypothetical protein
MRPTDPESGPASATAALNYFSIGIDAAIALKFHVVSKTSNCADLNSHNFTLHATFLIFAEAHRAAAQIQESLQQ